MNRVKVLFFATLRQRAGTEGIDLDLPEGMDVRGLKELLGRQYPDLRESMASVLIAINREYAFDDAIIPDQCEIAFFPPVSGG